MNIKFMIIQHFKTAVVAMEKEMEAMDRLGVFEYVQQHSVGASVKVISCRWVYKIKPDKLKARLVIRGFLQDVSGEETFSPTMKMVTVRLLLALAAFLGWIPHVMDVSNAFLNAEITGSPIYMRCVQGFEKPGFIIRVRKALYGPTPH